MYVNLYIYMYLFITCIYIYMYTNIHWSTQQRIVSQFSHTASPCNAHCLALQRTLQHTQASARLVSINWRRGPMKSKRFFTWQRIVAHCNTLQRIATHCNTLQPSAAHCNTHYNVYRNLRADDITRVLYVTIHCNTMQHDATRCNTMQRTASHSQTHFSTPCNDRADEIKEALYVTWLIRILAMTHLSMSHDSAYAYLRRRSWAMTHLSMSSAYAYLRRRRSDLKLLRLSKFATSVD